MSSSNRTPSDDATTTPPTLTIPNPSDVNDNEEYEKHVKESFVNLHARSDPSLPPGAQSIECDDARQHLVLQRSVSYDSEADFLAEIQTFRSNDEEYVDGNLAASLQPSGFEILDDEDEYDDHEYEYYNNESSDDDHDIVVMDEDEENSGDDHSDEVHRDAFDATMQSLGYSVPNVAQTQSSPPISPITPQDIATKAPLEINTRKIITQSTPPASPANREESSRTIKHDPSPTGRFLKMMPLLSPRSPKNHKEKKSPRQRESIPVDKKNGSSPEAHLKGQNNAVPTTHKPEFKSPRHTLRFFKGRTSKAGAIPSKSPLAGSRGNIAREAEALNYSSEEEVSLNDDFSLDGEESVDFLLSQHSYGDLRHEQQTTERTGKSLFPQMPNSFVNLSPEVFDFLDQSFIDVVREDNLPDLAHEHHVLTKAMLQLLAERDLIGVEGDLKDTSNIIKMGPLKKRYAQLYFVKYVEIRKGNLIFFDDKATDDKEYNRTIVHLRKRTCFCDALVKDGGSTGGCAFELRIEGRPKQTWMAKSEDERDAWIRAINQAMIGETEDSQDAPLDMSIYQSSVDCYRNVQQALQNVTTELGYRQAIDPLLYRQSASSALRIPVQWFRAHSFLDEEVEKEEPNAPHLRVRSNVTNFWKSLRETSVEINGFEIPSSSPYSAERIIGSLTRCILEYDKVEYQEHDIGLSQGKVKLKRGKSDTCMSEVQAVSYARSILMGVLKSTSRGDSLASVERLLRNEHVDVIEAGETGSLHIDVSFVTDDLPEYDPKHTDLAGWISTKPKKNKTVKSRYFVASEGILSIFEGADPRPTGLKGQIVLQDADVTVDQEEMAIQIEYKGVERVLAFQVRSNFIKWKATLEGAPDPELVTTPQEPGSVMPPGENPSTNRRRKTGIKVGKRAMKAVRAGNNTIIMIKKAMRSRNRSKQSQDLERRRQTKDLVKASTRGLKAENAEEEQREPTVQVAVELNMMFHVKPATNTSSSPKEKDDNDDNTVLFIQTKLFQAFLLSGSKLARGDEVLEMEFLAGDGAKAALCQDSLEPPTVL